MGIVTVQFDEAEMAYLDGARAILGLEGLSDSDLIMRLAFIATGTVIK